MNRRTTPLIAWGIPILALIVAIGLDHPSKTVVWVAALVWMGIACLINARRCGRMHCHFTGPFFLLLAVFAGLHGYAVLELGDSGWPLLGATLLVGSAILTVAPDKLLGKYAGSRRTQA